MSTIQLNNGTYRAASPCDKCKVLTVDRQKRAIINKSVDWVCESCYYNVMVWNKQKRIAQEV
jgi:ribosomal protein L37AE/L43A